LTAVKFGFFVCTICNFRATSEESLAIHGGTRHAHFIQFLPTDVAENYRLFASKNGAAKKRGDAPHVEARGVAAVAETATERFICNVCAVEFDSLPKLASHMTNVRCKPSGRPSPAMSAVGCKICGAEVGSFRQYKGHLLAHFEEKLDEDWSGQEPILLNIFGPKLLTKIDKKFVH
jgi:hypothetical protein